MIILPTMLWYREAVTNLLGDNIEVSIPQGMSTERSIIPSTVEPSDPRTSGVIK